MRRLSESERSEVGKPFTCREPSSLRHRIIYRARELPVREKEKKGRTCEEYSYCCLQVRCCSRWRCLRWPSWTSLHPSLAKGMETGQMLRAAERRAEGLHSMLLKLTRRLLGLCSQREGSTRPSVQARGVHRQLDLRGRNTAREAHSGPLSPRCD